MRLFFAFSDCKQWIFVIEYNTKHLNKRTKRGGMLETIQGCYVWTDPADGAGNAERMSCRI